MLWKKQSIGTENNCQEEFLLQFKPEGIIKLLSILCSNVYTKEGCFLASALHAPCRSFIFSFLKDQQYSQFVAIVAEWNAQKPNFLVNRQDSKISYKLHKLYGFTRQTSVFTVSPGELVELMKYLQLVLELSLFKFHFIVSFAGERSLLHYYPETGKFCMFSWFLKFLIFTYHCVYLCPWYLKSWQMICSVLLQHLSEPHGSVQRPLQL